MQVLKRRYIHGSGTGESSAAFRTNTVRKGDRDKQAVAPRSNAPKSLGAGLSLQPPAAACFQQPAVAAGITFPGKRQPVLLRNRSLLARASLARLGKALPALFPLSSRKRLRHGGQPWGALSCCSWRISSRGEAARSSVPSRGSPASSAPTALVTCAPEQFGLRGHSGHCLPL